jgi:hypothetical protein
MAVRSRRNRHDRGGVLLLVTLVAYLASGSSVSGQGQPAFRVLAIHLAGDEPGSAAANLTWYTTLRETHQSQVQRPVDYSEPACFSDAARSCPRVDRQLPIPTFSSRPLLSCCDIGTLQ